MAYQARPFGHHGHVFVLLVGDSRRLLPGAATLQRWISKFELAGTMKIGRRQFLTSVGTGRLAAMYAAGPSSQADETPVSRTSRAITAAGAPIRRHTAESDDPGQQAITGDDGRVVHAGVEFHGVAELRRVKDLPGLRLQRIPESMRAAINSQAGQRMLGPDGAEIRLVSQEDTVEVTLSAPTGGADMVVFWGEFQDIQRYTIGRQPRTIKLTYPERVQHLKPGICCDHAFQPQVWRLTFMGESKASSLHFHDIFGQGLRPPRPEEVPSQTYLAYGTSVTDGFSATAMHLTYIAQTARHLGANLINLGSAGSAYCEPELADYIAARKDWSVATLCISANMIGAGFSVDEFCHRASYMVNTIAASDPKRLVVCVTIWPYFGDLCRDVEGLHGKGLAEPYREVLREIVAQSPYTNVHLVEGRDLLMDIAGYTMDLAHPGDHGMIEIGAKLARHITKLQT